ncbi:hypothetical protein BJ944DRAFT_274190 [Cunninghamella echinulata]|nr:hypothetical protein BJ944DRAFT_274190 [Cunninghamella echinulata]
MMTPKTYTQQRAVLRPNRNVAFFDDDDFIEDDMQSNHDNTDIYSLTEDDGSSMHSILTNTDTLVLAQFLANTGPEEFMKPTKQQQQNPQFHRASRLFNKLRKKGGNVFSNLQQQQQQQQQTNNNNKRYTNSNSIRSMKSQQSNQEKKNYIPLPVYQPPLSSPQPTTTTKTNNQQHELITIKPSVSTSSSTSTSYHRRQKRNLSISSSSSSHHIALRDSGIYSETSEKGDDLPPPLPSPPMIPSKSYYRLQQQQNQQPKRPAPLPPAVASAAIASATTNTSVDQYTSMDHSSILNQRRKSIGKHPIPSAALKRKSITRIRHIQVQTDNNNYSKDDGNNNSNKSNNSNVCQHCHQAFLHKNDNDEYNGKRRTSCPSILPTGQLLSTNNNNNNNNQLDAKDAMQLLSMIEQLKLQLAEEQKSRLLLEQTIQRQLNGNKL